LELLKEHLECKKQRMKELKSHEDRLREVRAERRKLSKDAINLAQRLVEKGLDLVRMNANNSILGGSSTNNGTRGDAASESRQSYRSHCTTQHSAPRGTGFGMNDCDSSLSSIPTSANSTSRGGFRLHNDPNIAIHSDNEDDGTDEENTDKVWNSKLSESHIFSVHLRKLIRKQREES
jgi:hypothetical protein